MQTADYNYQDFHQPRAGDEKLAVRFFIKPKQDGEKSQTEGRPIFREVEYIQIMIPGDRGHIIVRPVSDQDRGRFGKQYEHWKKLRDDSLAEGTPLENWGLLNLAQIEEFKYFGIRTVEHMASIRDDLAGKIPGTHGLKQKAQEYLDVLKMEAPMKKVAAELERRDAEMASMKVALEDQAAIIAELRQKLGMPAIEQPTGELPPTPKRPRSKTA